MRRYVDLLLSQHFPVVLLNIRKGQKPEPKSGTKFSELKFTIIKTVL